MSTLKKLTSYIAQFARIIERQKFIRKAVVILSQVEVSFGSSETPVSNVGLPNYVSRPGHICRPNAKTQEGMPDVCF